MHKRLQAFFVPFRAILKWCLPIGISMAAPCFANFAYVANSADSTVSVINTATQTVFDTINLPANSNCQNIAITPNRKFAYVTNFNSNTVTVISTITNTITETISGGFNGPLDIAFNFDGSFAYVTNNGTNTVSVIDVNAQAVTATITVGNAPVGIATTPDGQFVYVANNLDGTVSAIATANNTVIATIPVDSGPFGVAITPNGLYVYVSNENSNDVFVIEVYTNTVVAAIPVDVTPQYLSISPDGTLVFVPNAGGDDVSFINTGTNTVIETVALIPGGAPVGSASAFTISYPSLYVTDNALGVVYAFYPYGNAYITALLTVGNAPVGVAIVPDAPPPLSPVSIRGFQTKNGSNVISWDAPFSYDDIVPAPIRYLVYRDNLSNVIGEVSASDPLRFVDCHVRKNTRYIYYVFSVSEEGFRSRPAVVVVYDK